MNTLWVVSPVYLDVESFMRLHSEVRDVYARLPFNTACALRFVVVDDTGNQDPELVRLRDLTDVSVIHVPFNLGHQRAIVYGLRSLSVDVHPDDWVVTMDADGEDQPADLPKLLASLQKLPTASNHVVLALRMKRSESPLFKLLYTLFKLFFRLLTGTVIRTGNYAAFHGALAKRVLFHPYFDLSYSSTLLSLNIPAVFVPCDRGERYAGQSRMGVAGLFRHGLMMLMPFTDRIATRALVAFGGLFAAGLIASVAVVAIRMLTALAIPGWASYMLLLIVAISVTALGNFIIMFVLFAQSSGLSLRGLHGRRLGYAADDARDTPAGAGREHDASVLASSPLASRVDDAARKGRL
jgi:polyisoprenyl-phosphate glycosyltransferase